MLIVSYLFTQVADAQTRQLKGKITDEKTGESLPGVNVRAGDNIRTVSDQNGNYLLAVPASNNSALAISYVGYIPQTIQIGTRTEINVRLVPLSQGLEEVVVVGYGAVKKQDLTGSVAQVNITDMQKAPVKSFDDALAGRVAGVEVSSNEGQPGISNNIVIRGNNSVTQDNTPLYVIDGFPIDNPNNNVINPEEIETITVLKDASSTAIYGSRGANGVIVITTKRGAIGEPVVKYNGYVAVQRVSERETMMGAL
ncbi:TonB-dependent receptor plug domain-containing protein [Pedobacter agri]|uniref:TonB-dependent receptor plug domain-containing protein n=1 Tax=Pedobacter agri TaxID=454586 RepID=UPI0027D78064|nr:TonB-dependent receptor plug domain-containing protein [Pedobacter agri]